MLDFDLATKRRITLTSFRIVRTSDCIDLRDESRGRRPEVEQAVRKLVSQTFPGSEVPWTIVWPSDGHGFGFALCLASFTSSPMSLHRFEGLSHLVVCWSVWHADRPLREIVRAGLSELNWEAQARDFGWW